MLDQEPVECLFQFICSSNNHISRIEGLVRRLASDYGIPLPIAVDPLVEGAAHGASARDVRGDAALEDALAGAPFHAFPTIEQLEAADEAALRAAGFGYRAKFIVGTVRELGAKPGGAEAWLAALRASDDEAAVVEELCSLPGVGPKVAACVALFSLAKPRLVPVDVHVLALAAKRYAPHLRNRAPSPTLHAEVQQAFAKRFGDLAGWAHNSLFVAEVQRSRRGRVRGRGPPGHEGSAAVAETPPPKKRAGTDASSPETSTPELVADGPATRRQRATRSARGP